MHDARSELMGLESCIYCGSGEEPTADHVPPKAVFPKPRRASNLITVPSCRKCNKSFEKDDEYFKHHLAMRRDIQDRHDAQKLLAEVRRAWDRKEGAGLTAFVAATLVRREVVGDPGSRVEELGQYIDSTRLGRTLDRTVRGLYFHHTRRRIPPTYRLVSTLSEAAPPEYQIAIESMMFNAPDYAIADGMFAYSFLAAPEDPYSTMWLLQFYGEALFYSVTGPPKGLQQPG